MLYKKEVYEVSQFSDIKQTLSCRTNSDDRKITSVTDTHTDAQTPQNNRNWPVI